MPEDRPGLTREQLARRKAIRRKRRIRGFAAMLVVVFFTTVLCTYLYFDSSFLSSKNKDRVGDGNIHTQLVTPEEVDQDVSYFLIAGADLSSNLTDIIMLACFDHKANTMSILQIPRDTYVGKEVPSGKMNAVYGSPQTVDWCSKCKRSVEKSELSGGVHVTCDTMTEQKREGRVNALIRIINEKLSLPIDHSVVFTIEGFREMVDAMGGVEVEIPTTMDYGQDGVEAYLEEGLQTLNGVQAEWFVRHRRTYAMGDLGRIQAQRNFFSGFAKKVMGLGLGDFTNLLPVVASNENITTDMRGTQMLGYAMNAKKLTPESIRIFTLPGEPAWKDGISYYSCHVDETTELLNEYFLPYQEKITEDTIKLPEIDRQVAHYSQGDSVLGDY